MNGTWFGDKPTTGLSSISTSKTRNNKDICRAPEGYCTSGETKSKSSDEKGFIIIVDLHTYVR